MNPQEFDSQDLQRASVHEVAHANVARHYGHWALPWVSPTWTDNPIEEKLWGGRTIYAKGLSKQQARRQAIAGELAEIILEDPSLTEDELENSLWESYHDEHWSQTDLDGAEGWTHSDFRAVHAILSRKWEAICEEALCLTQELFCLYAPLLAQRQVKSNLA